MTISTLLNKYNLSPRKGLGQNFLVDGQHLDKIVAAANLTSDDTVLEIGPGPGSLTERLARQAGQVIAVELDPNMIHLLQHEYGHLPNLTLIEADILATPIADLLRGIASASTYKVVANLPYYITSAVLRHVLEAVPQPSRVVVTIQQEVAERIVAQPGQLSVLAISVQFYGQPRLVHRIPAGAFYPPPKVDSAVVQIDTYPQPPIPVQDVEQFFRIVKAGFSQKRKQLKNTLTSGLQLPTDTVVSALNNAGIEFTRRAQTLSLAEWGQLVDALQVVL